MTTVGWETRRLGSLAHIRRGSSPRPISSPRWFDSSSSVGWVRIGDVAESDGRVLQRTSQRLSSDGIARSRLIAPGTLIMSIAATVGRPVVTGFTTCIHDGFVSFERLRGVDREFLFYVLKNLEDSWSAAGQTGSQTNVNTTIVSRTVVSIPAEKREQRRIAAVLGDADDQITALRQMIAKKQAIKQGMMQELLTGKTRLPGFTDERHSQALGQVATIDPEALSPATDARVLLDYISLEDVDRGELLGHTRVRFGSAPSRARRVIKDGDVLFGTVRPNLQSHAYYRGGLKHPIASTGFAVVRALHGRSAPQFLFVLLMSHLTTVQVDRIIAGSNYPAVSSGDVFRLTFSFPPLDEQLAIGSALADCDEELSTLKRRLAKARNVKQGMMQELLSGRTRLPVAESAA